MAKTQTTDEAVMELLVKVQEKKAEIKKSKTRPQWKTNCTLGRDPESSQGRVNIQTVVDQNRLVDMYAFLLNQENLLDKAMSELNIDSSSSPVWQSFPIADWKDDIKTRINQLQVEEKERELDALDKRVNKLVTPEQRREMELVAIKKMLH